MNGFGKVKFNGQEVDKVKLNGEVVFERVVFDPNTTMLLKSIDGVIVDIKGNEVINNQAIVNENGFTLGSNSGYLELPYEVFNNEGDFTIEWVENCTSAYQNSTTSLLYAGAQGLDGNPYGGFMIGYTNTGVNVYAGTLLQTWNILAGVSLKTRTLNTDVMWCFQRKNSDLYVYKDGALTSTVSCQGVLFKHSDAKVFIGRYNGQSGYNAHIKEFKISNIARYTDNFTPDINEIFKN